MITDDTRIQIENITKGIILKGNHDHCTTIRNLLYGRFSTSTTVKEKFESNAIIKKEQAQFLEQSSKEHGLWIHELPPAGKYLTQGGEARVYYNECPKTFAKVQNFANVNFSGLFDKRIREVNWYLVNL